MIIATMVICDHFVMREEREEYDPGSMIFIRRLEALFFFVFVFASICLKSLFQILDNLKSFWTSKNYHLIVRRTTSSIFLIQTLSKLCG